MRTPYRLELRSNALCQPVPLKNIQSDMNYILKNNCRLELMADRLSLSKTRASELERTLATNDERCFLIQVTCNINVKAKTWNEIIRTVARPNEKILS